MALDDFAAALETSAAKAFAGQQPAPRDVERYLRGLHLEDLALACACAAGHEAAWDHFVREIRPVLYRAADALDPSGGTREIADAMYADLYGIKNHGVRFAGAAARAAPTEAETRASLFRYFHGRSSLATWLRAVLAQRHVDAIRAGRRTEPLPDEADGTPQAVASPHPEPDPERGHLASLVLHALRMAVERLAPRDRLRFACYYADGLTLAETGRLLGDHEATVSRHLARTRWELRAQVERHLRDEVRLNDAQIARAFECAAEDAGAFDLSHWATRKNPGDERSI